MGGEINMNPSNSLELLLSKLLPLAAKWVRDREAEIMSGGVALTPEQRRDAIEAGVQSPEKIRLQAVRNIPLPAEPMLNRVARETGLLGPGTAGLTLRYGIYLRDDVLFDRELQVHEFVHVGQYERLGSIEAFLALYLRECVDPGYPLGPLEQEAIVTAGKIVKKL